MAKINDVLKSINENDRKKFLDIRLEFRRMYLWALNITPGVGQYNDADDYALDQLDLMVENLMRRAGAFDPPKPSPDKINLKSLETEIVAQQKVVAEPAKDWQAK